MAALVAAGVSSLGLLVSIYVARQARRAVEARLKLEVQLNEERDIVRSFRALEAEGERLRIGVADLLGCLSLGVASPGTKCAMFELARRQRSFLESWATVKGDVPEGIEAYLRALRHQCRELLERTVRYLEEQNSDRVSTCEKNLEHVLLLVDRFTMVSRAIRKGEAVLPNVSRSMWYRFYVCSDVAATVVDGDLRPVLRACLCRAGALPRGVDLDRTMGRLMDREELGATAYDGMATPHTAVQGLDTYGVVYAAGSRRLWTGRAD